MNPILDKQWTPHGGGPKPLGLLLSDRVYLRFRDGSDSKVRVAGNLRWEHENLPDDIVEWRLAWAAREV